MQDFSQICDVTRHNVHCGHVFHTSRKSGVAQGKKHIKWLLWVAVESPWSVMDGQFLTSFAQMGVENATTTLYTLHF